MKSFKKFILPALTFCSIVGLATSCGGAKKGLSPEGNTNTVFFALYNYYGQEGQHFTNRWLGMMDALNEYGIKVSGWEQQIDAKEFKIDMSESTLPKDTEIYMVNNRTWDIGLQYAKPLADKRPLAVISTCNGVEFASEQIKAVSPGTQNATMGGFSKSYRTAFQDNSLHYLATKYTCHVAPIVAACVNNVLAEKDPEHYEALRVIPEDANEQFTNPDGYALQLSLTHWDLKSIEDYDKHAVIDNYTDNPTIKKADLDPFFTKGGAKHSAEALTEWVKASTYEDIKGIYDANRDVVDEVRKGPKLKAGLIVPGSLNEVVAAYADYIEQYLGRVYNIEFIGRSAVTKDKNQEQCTRDLCNTAGLDFIISLQDDPERNKAITLADSKGIYFANAGTCQNDKDYNEVKGLKHFVGSIGSSITEERRVTREMTKHYLDIINERGVL